MERVFREHIDAGGLQDSRQILVKAAGLVENGHHRVGADRNPYLSLHSALARAAEGLDPQVLLDPLEELLDLPTRLLDLRHEWVEIEVVREENQDLSRFRIQVLYASEARGAQALGLRSVEPNGLVGWHPARLAHPPRRSDAEAHVRLRSDHEEGVRRVDAGETPEVEIAAVHHSTGASFVDDPVQGFQVVYSSLRNRHERWDGAEV